MAQRALQPCGEAGCHTLTREKGGRCEDHTIEPWHQTKTASERGYGYRWSKLRKYILARDEWMCQPCKTQGMVTRATQVDHIISRAKGGTDEPSNLQGICKTCHEAKTIEERKR